MSEAGSLRGHVETLAAALELWATRDDTKAQPEVRRVANDAVDAIDAALLGLHQVRQALVCEIRRSDEAAMARTEALLARRLMTDSHGRYD